MKTNADRANEFRSLAADIEDVLLRFRGNPSDGEILRDVADELYEVADDFYPVRILADC